MAAAVLDAGAQAPHSPSNVLELMRKRTAEAAHFDALVAVLADWFVEVHRRTGPVVAVIAQAAAVHPAVEKLQTARALQRLERYGEAAASVRSCGALQSGMSDADAAAAIWSLGNPQTYRALLGEAGWPVKSYRDWLKRALAAALA